MSFLPRFSFITRLDPFLPEFFLSTISTSHRLNLQSFAKDWLGFGIKESSLGYRLGTHIQDLTAWVLILALPNVQCDVGQVHGHLCASASPSAKRAY